MSGGIVGWQAGISCSVRTTLCFWVALYALHPYFASAQTKQTDEDYKAGNAFVMKDTFQERHAGSGDEQNGLSTGDTVRIVVRSYQYAAISAEINARIIRLPEREGDRFRKGDVIIEFECTKVVAELSAAAAVLKAQQSAYENQRQLLQYKAVGSFAVDHARFEMEKAQADLHGQEAKRAACTIHAPFDGRVTEKMAQIHEIAQSNQPLIRIINERKLELVVMVPSNWLGRVKEGDLFPVKLDETGDRHNARILQSTGQIDPVSQSARFIAEIMDAPSTVLPGMSGTATLPRSGVE